MRSIRLHLTVLGRPADAVYTSLADLGHYFEASYETSSHQIRRWQPQSDVGRFDGSWSCVADGADTAVTFAARLDMGIPPRADALEPTTARTFIDSTVAMVSGVFEGGIRVDDVVIQGHEPATVAAR
ncbi:MAG: hypothetical protein M3083_12425 [Actinomycetota bacterium]|nr:hypothetical protein [Actinomycetota bacterium]MDQ6946940.1 hypothetical protein [Actinomycetota bacterium]